MISKIALPEIGEISLDEDKASLLFRVLLLDDDPTWLDSTKECIEEESKCTVVTAQTSRKASDIIRSTTFHAIIADAILAHTGLLSPRGGRGDQWLVKHAKYAPDALKVVVTAYPERVQREGVLENSGIRLLVKSHQEELDMYDEIKSLADRRYHQNISSIKDAVGKVIQSFDTRMLGQETELGLEITNKAAEIFCEWANTRKEPDTQTLWYGDRCFSIREIGLEVSDGSAVGKKFLAMFLKHIRYKIGLADSPMLSSSTEADS
jgi:DNA-binding NarL/FixJ family response regulator